MGQHLIVFTDDGTILYLSHPPQSTPADWEHVQPVVDAVRALTPAPRSGDDNNGGKDLRRKPRHRA